MRHYLVVGFKRNYKSTIDKIDYDLWQTVVSGSKSTYYECYLIALKTLVYRLDISYQGKNYNVFHKLKVLDVLKKPSKLRILPKFIQYSKVVQKKKSQNPRWIWQKFMNSQPETVFLFFAFLCHKPFLLHITVPFITVAIW